ncbi:glutaredoxin [Sorangium sp. So ce1000]|uniref:glutaredoxin n=1 Tax=Sorangium sp. So ce1000 TaxID=3133325 RepID=UPI003F5D7B60
MIERHTLAPEKMSDAVKSQMAGFHREVVDEVAAAVSRDRIVVVGMAQNPFVKRARQLLDGEGVTYTYLEYGSYFSRWKARLAIKLWAGFPTFPMVFVDGVLEGGYAELVKLRDQGALKKQP